MIDLMKKSLSDATVAAASQTQPSPSDALGRASVPGLDAAQQTGAADWRLQSSTNRQGSANSSCSRDVGEKLSAEERALHRRAREVYEARIETGVAREQARKDLPLSTYTEAYWKIDLHNLLHFLRLRMSSHAQQEIRAYALIIGNDIVSQWVPTVWEAFGDYTQHCLQFSRLESEIVRALVSGERSGALRLAEEHNFIRVDRGGEITPSREGHEFAGKTFPDRSDFSGRLAIRAP